jgi:hypothetical protein
MTPDPGDATSVDAATDRFLAQARRCTIEQRTAMDEALNRFSATSAPECQLAIDTSALRGPGRRTVAQNKLYHRGWRLAFLMATNVGDHLVAVGDVASRSPRLFAHMTLARAALEGAARIHYLLHPSGTLRERVLRSTALLVASSEEELKAAAELSTGRPGLHAAAMAAAKGRSANTLGLVKSADIELQRRKRDGQVHGVLWPNDPDTLTLCQPNVTGLLRTLMPAKPAAYRVGSGAVHSQPWVLDDDEAFDFESRQLKWKFDPAALAGSVDLAVAASMLTIEAFAAMLGHDPSPERSHARHREREVSKLAVPLVREPRD